MRAVEMGNRIYIMPRNAMHFLIIENKKIRKIQLREQVLMGDAFYSYYCDEKYIFLFPFRYPQVIRFTIKTEKIEYIEGIQPFYIREVNGEWKTGGIVKYGNEVGFASPEDNQFLFVDIVTLHMRVIGSHSLSNLGTQSIVPDGDDLWLLPINGMTITRWNPRTGDVLEYDCIP